MPSEIKIQCYCGHKKPISKSNISAHRKSKQHMKNMKAISKTIATKEADELIICENVMTEEIVGIQPVEKIRKIIGIINDQPFIDELYKTETELDVD